MIRGFWDGGSERNALWCWNADLGLHADVGMGYNSKSVDQCLAGNPLTPTWVDVLC